MLSYYSFHCRELLSKTNPDLASSARIVEGLTKPPQNIPICRHASAMLAIFTLNNAACSTEGSPTAIREGIVVNMINEETQFKSFPILVSLDVL